MILGLAKASRCWTTLRSHGSNRQYGQHMQAQPRAHWPCAQALPVGPFTRDAPEGKGPQRRPQRRWLEEVAKAVGGRLLLVTNAIEAGTWRWETGAGQRLGALEGGGFWKSFSRKNLFPWKKNFIGKSGRGLPSPMHPLAFNSGMRGGPQQPLGKEGTRRPPTHRTRAALCVPLDVALPRPALQPSRPPTDIALCPPDSAATFGSPEIMGTVSGRMQANPTTEVWHTSAPPGHIINFCDHRAPGPRVLLNNSAPPGGGGGLTPPPPPPPSDWANFSPGLWPIKNFLWCLRRKSFQAKKFLRL